MPWIEPACPQYSNVIADCWAKARRPNSALFQRGTIWFNIQTHASAIADILFRLSLHSTSPLLCLSVCVREPKSLLCTPPLLSVYFYQCPPALLSHWLHVCWRTWASGLRFVSCARLLVCVTFVTFHPLSHPPNVYCVCSDSEYYTDTKCFFKTIAWHLFAPLLRVRWENVPRIQARNIN